MIVLYLALFLLVQAVIGTEQHDGNGEATLQPVRRKRDISSLVCPKIAALDDELGQMSEIILYSPIDREDVVITYGSDGWSEMEVITLMENGFDSTKPTLLFTHGFRQSGYHPWLMNVRNIYDTIFSDGKEPTFNLLIHDWSSYPKYRYWASVSYLPFIGRELGEFIEQLGVTASYDLENLHLIAYSLSTHIAGLASRYVAKNYAPIGQLTALDPTGVCLQDSSQFGEENALRHTDAKLVVSRHYNMDGLGAKRFVGGLDILINGGRKQPRMDNHLLIRESANLILLYGRDHHRATEHETQAFDEQCHEIAYECDSYESYLRGECGDCGPDGSKCYLISNFHRLLPSKRGYKVTPILGYAPGTKMFLKTHFREPYCLHHYQLIAKLNPGTSAAIKTLLSSGRVELDLGNGNIVQLQGLADANQFTALASSESKLELSKAVALRVKASNSTTSALLGSLDYIDMNYMSHWSARERAEASYRLCFHSSKSSFRRCQA